MFIKTFLLLSRRKRSTKPIIPHCTYGASVVIEIQTRSPHFVFFTDKTKYKKDWNNSSVQNVWPLVLFQIPAYVSLFLLLNNSYRPNVIIPSDLLVFLFCIRRRHPFEAPLKLDKVSFFPSVRRAEMSCSLHLDECLLRRIVTSLRLAPPRSAKNAKGK
jgi:hypothetical protein